VNRPLFKSPFSAIFTSTLRGTTAARGGTHCYHRCQTELQLGVEPSEVAGGGWVVLVGHKQEEYRVL